MVNICNSKVFFTMVFRNIYGHFPFDVLINGSFLCLKYVFLLAGTFSLVLILDSWNTRLNVVLFRIVRPWFTGFINLNRFACTSIHLQIIHFFQEIKHSTPLKLHLFKYLCFFKHLNCWLKNWIVRGKTKWMGKKIIWKKKQRTHSPNGYEHCAK